tara:strand:- start:747 stop:971 length:225 start_codon:yes stop_codon:yes gene_type:complete
MNNLHSKNCACGACVYIKALKKENEELNIWKTRVTDLMEMCLNLMKICKEKDEENKKLKEENEELKETIEKKFW